MTSVSRIDTNDSVSVYIDDSLISEMKPKWSILSILLLSILSIAGICGNTLVCVAISVEKKLQNVTNYFLLSLAVADLVVSLVVMPCGILHELIGFWPLGLVMCNVWQVSDVIMCTSSIMHMTSISIDRYIGIHDPLKNRNKSRMTVLVKIAAVWLLSAAIGSPLIGLGLFRPEQILDSNKQCAIFNAYYLIYGSLAAFFGPLSIMLIAFTLTVRLLNKQARMLGINGSAGIRRCKTDRHKKSPHREQIQMRLVNSSNIAQAIGTSKIEHSMVIVEDENSKPVIEINTAINDGETSLILFEQTGNGICHKHLIVPGTGEERSPRNHNFCRNNILSLHLDDYELSCSTIQSEEYAQENGKRKSKSHTRHHSSCTPYKPKIHPLNRNSSDTSHSRSRNSGACVQSRKSEKEDRPKDTDFEKLIQKTLESPVFLDYQCKVMNRSKSVTSRSSGQKPCYAVASQNGATLEVFSATADSTDEELYSEAIPLINKTSLLKNGALKQTEFSTKTYQPSKLAHDAAYSQIRHPLVENGHKNLLKANSSGTDAVITKSPSSCDKKNYLNVDNSPQVRRSITEPTCLLCKIYGCDLEKTPQSNNKLNIREVEKDLVSISNKIFNQHSIVRVLYNRYKLANSINESLCTCSAYDAHSDQNCESTHLIPKHNSGNIDITVSYSEITSHKDKAVNVNHSRKKTSSGVKEDQPSFSNGVDKTYPAECSSTNDEILVNPVHKKEVNSNGNTKKAKTEYSEVISKFKSARKCAESQDTTESGSCLRGSSEELLSADIKSRDRSGSVRFKSLVRKHGAAFQVAGLLFAKREDRRKTEMSSVKTEQKAIKVIGAMFAIFFLCWAPFFSINLTAGLCPSCQISSTLFKTFLWLGYTSSTLNPIIYTIFNQTFKDTFLRLLRGDCCLSRAQWKLSGSERLYLREIQMAADTTSSNVVRRVHHLSPKRLVTHPSHSTSNTTNTTDTSWV